MRTSQSDGQVGGTHYSAGYDPISFSEKHRFTPMEFSVLKYITRHRLKGGKEDLLKAVHYLNMLLNTYTLSYFHTHPRGTWSAKQEETLKDFSENYLKENSLVSEEMTILRNLIVYPYCLSAEDGRQLLNRAVERILALILKEYPDV